MAPLRDSWIPLLMLLGAFFVNWLSPDASTGIAGTVGNLMDLVRLGLFVGAVGWIVYNVIVWRTAEFAVTNLRVIREEGFASRRASATLISGDHRRAVEGWPPGQVARLWRPGDLHPVRQRRRRPVLDDHQGGGVPQRDHDPQDGRLGSGTGGGGRRPRPPPSLHPPPRRVAPAPPADPVAALNSLADLRDRGAITPEEYEAKKTELLARM